jgi:hypothetical protein
MGMVIMGLSGVSVLDEPGKGAASVPPKVDLLILCGLTPFYMVGIEFELLIASEAPYTTLRDQRRSSE